MAMTLATKNNSGTNAKIFTLWLFLGTVIMIFASLTSAYTVRRAEGSWLQYSLPNEFLYSIFIAVLGSIAVQFTYFMRKKENRVATQVGIILTAAMGVAFLASQFLGWNSMVEDKFFFVGNPSVSFVYVISFVHAIHILATVVVTMVGLMKSTKDNFYTQNSILMLSITTLWHFLGGLWIYLYLFLSYNR